MALNDYHSLKEARFDYLLYIFIEAVNGEVQCNTGQFSCGNKKCIPLEKKCNTINDCGDSSDELNCGNVSDNMIGRLIVVMCRTV